MNLKISLKYVCIFTLEAIISFFFYDWKKAKITVVSIIITLIEHQKKDVAWV